MKDLLKYARATVGEGSAHIAGISMMPELSADSWDSQLLVSL